MRVASRLAWYVMVALEAVLMLAMWLITADAWLKGGIAAGIVATVITAAVCGLIVSVLREVKPT